MGHTPTDDGSLLSELTLDDDQYRVEQSLFRSRYKAVDSDGDVAVRGKKKRFQLTEKFPFETPDGTEAFRVVAGGVLDVAGDYTVFDAPDENGDGEPVLLLDKNYSLYTHKWKLRDPETEALIATIESKRPLVSVLRSFSRLANLIPHAYEITDTNGERVGRIEGQFSLNDTYDVHVDDAADVPTEGVVVAAIVIDAIEGN